MVGFAVDVERDVVRLIVGHVSTIAQVEGDIKEVYNFLVGFNRYFEAMLSEDVAQIFLNLLVRAIPGLLQGHRLYASQSCGHTSP